MSHWVRYFSFGLLACCLAAGCADTKQPTTRPASLRERTDSAIRDPMGDPEFDVPTVSGAAGNKLDRKGMRRDWDRFWNP
jgi:hypothetical protein